MKNLKNFKQFNLDNKIPIMRDQTIKYLFNKFNNYHKVIVLEIGTGFGYSSTQLSNNQNIFKIIKLKNNIEGYKIASKITKQNQKIIVINESGFVYSTFPNFNCIILDGPKSKLNVLFEKYSST